MIGRIYIHFDGEDKLENILGRIGVGLMVVCRDIFLTRHADNIFFLSVQKYFCASLRKCMHKHVLAQEKFCRDRVFTTRHTDTTTRQDDNKYVE